MPLTRPMGERGGGDLADAFAELVRVEGPRLRRLASGYARGSDASDLLQEILLQIWRSLPGFRGESSVETWAYRIALNTGLSHLRRDLKRRAVEMASPGGPEEWAAPVSARHVPPGADAERILDDFLGSLGPMDRAVMLGYLEGLTHEQIAEVVGSTSGAIAVRISRMKTAFKRRYLGG